MRSLKKISIIAWVSYGLTATILANPMPQDLSTQYGLGQTSLLQHVILLPPKTGTASILTQQPDYLFIEPGTEVVVIKPQPHRFTKEANTFKSHRLHYIAFWAVFFLMRGTQWGG